MEKVKNKESNTPNRSIWQNFKSTYKYAKKGKKYLWIFLIINVLMTIISVIAPIMAAQRLLALTSNNYSKLLVFILLIFGIEIIRNFCNLAYNYTYSKFYYDARKNLQLELIRETLRITQKDLNNNSSGVFIERINGDTDNLTDIFTILIDYITDLIGNLGILVTVFFINFYLGILYIFVIIIFFLYNKFSSNIIYENRKKYKKSREKTGGFISEIVRGSKDIKILDAEKSFLIKANDYIKETNNISYHQDKNRSLLRLLGGSIRDMGDLIVSVFIFIFLSLGSLRIESAIVIYNYHGRIISLSEIGRAHV